MKKIMILVMILTLSLLAKEAKNEENVDYGNVEDSQTKMWMDKWLEGDFGLKPYKVNYILPVSHRFGSKTYRDYDNATPYSNTEAELQVSLKLGIGGNLLGLNEKYYLAYTHTAFWQIYVESSPFRETNYSPEAFVVFPVQDSNSIFHLINVKLGLGHISNGQGQTFDSSLYEYHYQDPNNQSRSLNFVYTELTMQHKSVITALKLWYRLPEDIASDDNPDYTDYTGNAELSVNYFYKKHKFCVKGRYNPVKNYGAVESAYSYPLIKSVYLYAKVFSGYGESLIDYNHNITKASIGFSFSR